MDPLTASIIAKPAVNLVKLLLKPLIEKLGKGMSLKAQQTYHNLFNSYSTYLENAYERHSYFNSIVFKNEQKKLIEYYLPLTLIKQPANEETTISAYPKKLIGESKKILIVDTAGMGKTTLLKYLFLGCVDEKAGIPIYIELRKLTKKRSIFDFITEQISDIGKKCNPDLLYKLLESGEFVIFLDGYDEIPESERTDVVAKLQDFIEKLPTNKYLLTSREENGLVAFPQFQRYTIKPLLLDEAYELLRKYATPELANLLINNLNQAKNKAIHEFLANPLLTSLLYKSFEYKNVIPLKRHIFYRQVYEALYELHDLIKESGEFQRAKRSGLNVDSFERILRCLGALSYRKGKMEFSRQELLGLIDEAKIPASESKIISSHILHDLTHAVPLMIEDGNYIRWSHRSIQEYFAARYICNDTKGAQETILLGYIQKLDFTSHLNLISLCADIDGVAFRQSIGERIAETLLQEANSLFVTHNSAISNQLILERKSLTVGKESFFVRVRLPENFSWHGTPQAHEIFVEVEKPIKAEIIRLQNELNVNHEHTMTLANPGICIYQTVIGKIVESLFQITELPFIEMHIPVECLILDSIDQNINVLKINDDPTNPVNDPKNFLLVNNLLGTLQKWRFSAQTAQDYLRTIEIESKAQQELSIW